MDGSNRWRKEGVKVVRADTLPGHGRATVFEFTGSGGRQTWIGTVSLPPGAATAAHEHGRHEVAVHVVRGRGRIRWGDSLEFAADVGPGDFVYFAPGVPHQEVNLEPAAALDFVVVRSDAARIAIDLPIAPVEEPELVY